MKTTTRTYILWFLLLCVQFLTAQKGVEALFIKEGTLLKCENNKIPADGRIELPRTVKMIGAEAFKDCNRLKSIDIGGGVTAIDERAFLGCAALEGVEMLPNSVQQIGVQAFAYCSKLQSVTLPNSVTEIGEEAFRGCFLLQQVDIPESVTVLGGRVFLDNTNLKEVNFITQNLRVIPSGLIYQCKELKKVNLRREIGRASCRERV